LEPIPEETRIKRVDHVEEIEQFLFPGLQKSKKINIIDSVMHKEQQECRI
jgi:hypothetical protein